MDKTLGVARAHIVDPHFKGPCDGCGTIMGPVVVLETHGMQMRLCRPCWDEMLGVVRVAWHFHDNPDL